MRVVARTDPHAVRDEVRAAHPDWIAVNADGSPRRHWANKDLWVTCALGPYNFVFMDAVHREIVTKYRVDGIFSNRWAPQGGECFCEHCTRNFKAATGHDLPRDDDAGAVARREFVEWRTARLTELWKRWDATVRSVNPGARFIPNGPPDLKTAGELADIQFTDNQARRGLTPPWANGHRAKEYRSVMGRRPIGGIFSVGVEERYRWKDSVQSEPEIQLWVAEGTANGMRPWVTKFSGVLYDRRWLPVVERIYDWHYRHERYLRNEAPIARVALLFSEQTEKYHAGVSPTDRAGDHVLGMYHALVESRVPFELVHEAYLTDESLDRFRLLILADAAALSNAQCDAIRRYVARGGTCWRRSRRRCTTSSASSARTSAWPTCSACRLAAASTARCRTRICASTPTPRAERHQILDGFGDTTRIIHGVHRLEVQPRADGPSPLTLIPTYPDLPMEDVYPRVPHTATRELYLREVGRSRIAYFPWDIGRSFWEVLSVDHLRLLRNTIAWAANEPPPVEVEGPGLLDVTAWRQRESMTVHLVNLTNPMMMKGPLREVFPIGPLKVRVRLPAGTRARQVRLLTADTSLHESTARGYRRRDGAVGGRARGDRDRPGVTKTARGPHGFQERQGNHGIPFCIRMDVRPDGGDAPIQVHLSSRSTLSGRLNTGTGVKSLIRKARATSATGTLKKRIRPAEPEVQQVRDLQGILRQRLPGGTQRPCGEERIVVVHPHDRHGGAGRCAQVPENLDHIRSDGEEP